MCLLDCKLRISREQMNAGDIVKFDNCGPASGCHLVISNRMSTLHWGQSPPSAFYNRFNTVMSEVNKLTKTDIHRPV